MSGGYQPGPYRTGSSAGSVVEAITRALLAAKGPLFANADTSSIAWVECNAYARAIWETYETTQRAKNCLIPSKCPNSLVPRWEAILGIKPIAGTPMPTRRAALTAKWELIGLQMDLGGLQKLLGIYASDVAPTVVHQPIATAVVHWGQPTVTIPGGPTLTQDTTLPLGFGWASSIHVIDIVLHAPTGTPLATIIRRINDLTTLLRDRMPVYDDPVVGITASDGSMSFLLDEPDLDLEFLS